MKNLFLFLCFLLVASTYSMAANVDTDIDNNGYIDIAYGGTNAATAANARTSLGVPATASTLAGSCTVGPCLDGTSDGGDLIKLYGPGGFWTALQAGNSVANRSWRLPLAAAPGAGTTRLMNMDENGQMGFVDPATFAAALGADDNYVTDAEKTVIGNTSGTNTGDQVISDTAYDATTWNANTDAATKNAIRDKIESLAGGHSAVTINATANGLSVDGSQVLTLGLASTSTIGALSDTDWDTFNNKVGLSSVPSADNQIMQSTGVGTYAWTNSLEGIGDFTDAGSYNKITITQPATGATLTLVDGSSLITAGAYSTTLTATGATDVTLPTTGTLATTVVPEVNGSASGNLTAANVSSTIVYNTGMGAADVALVLPTAASGYSVIFTVGTAQSNKWGVQAGASDKIYLLAADGTIAAGADNGYARMTAAQVGQSFACWTFKTDAYDWMCKSISIGTSTFAAN